MVYLRRRSATAKLLCNIEAHPNWPLYANVFDHPHKRLVARRPIWSDTTPVDQSAQWEEDWSSAAVVNSHLVCDPTIQQPGFDLPRHSWTLLNRFCTGQGPCRANMHKWGSCLISTLWLQRATDYRAHCQLVSNHKTGWRLVEPLQSRCHQLAKDDSDEDTREMKWNGVQQTWVHGGLLGVEPLSSPQGRGLTISPLARSTEGICHFPYLTLFWLWQCDPGYYWHGHSYLYNGQIHSETQQ